MEKYSKHSNYKADLRVRCAGGCLQSSTQEDQSFRPAQTKEKKLARPHLNKTECGETSEIPAMQEARAAGLWSVASLGKKHEILSEK
jgi:hypothetical protein